MIASGLIYTPSTYYISNCGIASATYRVRFNYSGYSYRSRYEPEKLYPISAGPGIRKRSKLCFWPAKAWDWTKALFKPVPLPLFTFTRWIWRQEPRWSRKRWKAKT